MHGYIMPTSESQKRAAAKYHKEKTTVKQIRFSHMSDADILKHLEGKVFGAYVKELIRKDMQKEEECPPTE